MNHYDIGDNDKGDDDQFCAIKMETPEIIRVEGEDTPGTDAMRRSQLPLVGTPGHFPGRLFATPPSTVKKDQPQSPAALQTPETPREDIELTKTSGFPSPQQVERQLIFHTPEKKKMPEEKKSPKGEIKIDISESM